MWIILQDGLPAMGWPSSLCLLVENVHNAQYLPVDVPLECSRCPQLRSSPLCEVFPLRLPHLLNEEKEFTWSHVVQIWKCTLFKSTDSIHSPCRGNADVTCVVYPLNLSPAHPRTLP